MKLTYFYLINKLLLISCKQFGTIDLEGNYMIDEKAKYIIVMLFILN